MAASVGPEETWRSAIAAVVLAVLVVAVFVSSQFSGPTSSVRAFHRALIMQDDALLGSVTEGDLNDPANVELRNYVVSLLNSATVPQVVDMDKQGTAAIVIVGYTFPQRGTALVPYYVRKTSNRWLISGSSTMDLIYSQRLP